MRGLCCWLVAVRCKGMHSHTATVTATCHSRPRTAECMHARAHSHHPHDRYAGSVNIQDAIHGRVSCLIMSRVASHHVLMLYQVCSKREKKKKAFISLTRSHARTNKQTNTRGHQRVSLSSDRASWYVSLLHAQLPAMQQATNMKMRDRAKAWGCIDFESEGSQNCHAMQCPRCNQRTTARA
jgi:hypothetical protein